MIDAMEHKTKNVLLNAVADALEGGASLMDSKWQKSESEVIASQSIRACRNNLESFGDAFSWLMASATSGRAQCGTNNADGMGRLIRDGSIIVEDYSGELSPPDGVVTENGKAQVVRVTESLLLYAARHIGLSDEHADGEGGGDVPASRV